jgi:hypothetical protein
MPKPHPGHIKGALRAVLLHTEAQRKWFSQRKGEKEDVNNEQGRKNDEGLIS